MGGNPSQSPKASRTLEKYNRISLCLSHSLFPTPPPSISLPQKLCFVFLWSGFCVLAVGCSCLFLLVFLEFQIIRSVLDHYADILHRYFLNPNDGMRCCRSDWPGLCLFCCYQPSCVVFVFFCFINFPILPPPPRRTRKWRSQSWMSSSAAKCVLCVVFFNLSIVSFHLRKSGGGGVKMENLWNKKPQINSVGWQHMRVRVDNSKTNKAQDSRFSSTASHHSSVWRG